MIKNVDDLNVAKKQTLLGTQYYLPIEILTGEKYSSKSDVFSVGIVLYEMVNYRKFFITYFMWF